MKNTDWFSQARFGLFIHWGLYALPARHEWVRNFERITDEAYDRYFRRFDPDRFDPRAWARAAKAAGMRYVVITSKHHEGFCLWDSAFTDYKATNTPAGRDLLREILDAFRAEGIRTGLYYSLLDWHHPDFPIDKLHPLRDLPPDEIARLNAGRDMARYREYMRNQVGELLTKYGPIDILWFDFSYPTKPGDKLPGKGRDDWGSEALLALVRRLAPDVIVNNRLDLPGAGDIVTPEQYQPFEAPRGEDGAPVVWEGCQTFSGSWGYHRDESTWKTPEQCIGLLVRHVACGGNLIMNVGPDGRGRFDGRAMDRLSAYAEWMDANECAIRGCGPAPAEWAPPGGAAYTYDPARRRLYLHLFDWPFRHVHLRGLAGKVEYAQFTHDHSEVLLREHDGSQGSHTTSPVPEDAVTLELPVVQPPVRVPVVELFLR